MTCARFCGVVCLCKFILFLLFDCEDIFADWLLFYTFRTADASGLTIALGVFLGISSILFIFEIVVAVVGIINNCKQIKLGRNPNDIFDELEVESQKKIQFEQKMKEYVKAVHGASHSMIELTESNLGDECELNVDKGVDKNVSEKYVAKEKVTSHTKNHIHDKSLFEDNLPVPRNVRFRNVLFHNKFWSQSMAQLNSLLQMSSTYSNINKPKSKSLTQVNTECIKHGMQDKDDVSGSQEVESLGAHVDIYTTDHEQRMKDTAKNSGTVHGTVAMLKITSENSQNTDILQPENISLLDKQIWPSLDDDAGDDLNDGSNCHNAQVDPVTIPLLTHSTQQQNNTGGESFGHEYSLSTTTQTCQYNVKEDLYVGVTHPDNANTNTNDTGNNSKKENGSRYNLHNENACADKPELRSKHNIPLPESCQNNYNGSSDNAQQSCTVNLHEDDGRHNTDIPIGPCPSTSVTLPTITVVDYSSRNIKTLHNKETLGHSSMTSVNRPKFYIGSLEDNDSMNIHKTDSVDHFTKEHKTSALFDSDEDIADVELGRTSEGRKGTRPDSLGTGDTVFKEFQVLFPKLAVPVLSYQEVMVEIVNYLLLIFEDLPIVLILNYVFANGPCDLFWILFNSRAKVSFSLATTFLSALGKFILACQSCCPCGCKNSFRMAVMQSERNHNFCASCVVLNTFLRLVLTMCLTFFAGWTFFSYHCYGIEANTECLNINFTEPHLEQLKNNTLMAFHNEKTMVERFGIDLCILFNRKEM